MHQRPDSTHPEATIKKGRAPKEAQRFTVLGVEIDDLDHDRALARIEQMIAEDTPGYVVFCTVSTVVMAGDDPELMAAIKEASMVTPDGMPLVWLGRRAGFDTQRVYGPDFLIDVLERTGGRYRHFFYGGALGVADQMVTELKKRFPDIEIAGTASPPFVDTPADASTWGLDAVAATTPDIVWVGLGHPKQEKWMKLHHHSLGAPVVAGVGAAFDFLSGQKKEAPNWMKRSGFQWLHRLFNEPNRLWRRYLIGNAIFIGRLARTRRDAKD